MSEIYKPIFLFLNIALLGACSSGGGDDNNTSVVSTPIIYEAASYEVSGLDDTNLRGLWMLVENSTLQFDLDDFSALEGNFDLNYQRRSLVFIDNTDTNDNEIVLLHCMENNSYTFVLGSANSGVINFSIEGFVFNGSVINNTRIEGSLEGSSSGVDMLNSEMTLLKINDLSSDIVDTGTMAMTIQTASQQENLQDLAPSCFEQVSFNGEEFIAGQLVPVEGESIYVLSFEDINNDSRLTVDESVSILMVQASSGDQQSSYLEIVTPKQSLITEGNALININENSPSILSGSVSGADAFIPSITGNATFTINVLLN